MTLPQNLSGDQVIAAGFSGEVKRCDAPDYRAASVGLVEALRATLVVRPPS